MPFCIDKVAKNTKALILPSKSYIIRSQGLTLCSGAIGFILFGVRSLILASTKNQTLEKKFSGVFFVAAESENLEITGFSAYKTLIL